MAKPPDEIFSGTYVSSPSIPAPPPEQSVRTPSKGTLRSLDWLNFFLADVQTGVGPFLAIYLAGQGWNEQNVGFALTVASLAGIATQAPSGALVDRSRAKRALLAWALAALAAGALAMAFWPSLWVVVMAQLLVGGASSIFIPAICAMSLGIVGRQVFDRRQGRNQSFNAAGNVTAALAMGLLGYYVSNRSIFFFVVLMGIPSGFALAGIRPEEIDHDLAQGARGGPDDGKAISLRELVRNKPLAIFLCCAVLFHFANAAMLPLLGETLARGKDRSSMMFMAACVMTTQFTITILSPWSGRQAHSWGRKPVLAIAFAALPIRGVLYTLTSNAGLLVAVQILDGIAAGIFGVVSILVIADLTRGTGRFNLTIGAITTAIGVGAALSQSLAGSLVHHVGYAAGFLFLAGVAAVALGIFWLFMPETKPPE